MGRRHVSAEFTLQPPSPVLDRPFRILGAVLLSWSERVAGGRPRHLMGHVSLFRFGGTTRPSRHTQNRMERALTRGLAGPPGWRSLHLAGSRS